jgi:hypothetical protein
MYSGGQVPPVRIPPRPARRGRWLYVGLATGGIAAVVMISGLVYVGREIWAEASGQGFHIDRSAVSAFREARKLRPGCQLRLSGYYDRVSSMVTVNADLVNDFESGEHVRLEVRGVSLMVERGIYDHQRVSHPTVMHQGDDPTKGYSVKFRRARDGFGSSCTPLNMILLRGKILALSG